MLIAWCFISTSTSINALRSHLFSHKNRNHKHIHPQSHNESSSKMSDKEASSQSPAGGSSFPLVWVLVAAAAAAAAADSSEEPPRQEPALLIEEYENMHLIEWKSNGERDFVESHRVSRRRKRGIVGSPASRTRSSSKWAWKHAATSPPTRAEAEDTTRTTTATSAFKEDTAHSIEMKEENDDDDDDDEVQVLLTILPPSPAKPKVKHAVTPLPPFSSAAITPAAAAATITPATEMAMPTSTPHSMATNANGNKPTTKVSADQPQTPASSSADRDDHSNENVALNRTLWTENHASDTPKHQMMSTLSTDRTSIPKTASKSVANETATDDTSEPTTVSASTSTTTPTSAAPIRFPSRSSAYLQSLAEICYAILWDVRWRVGGLRHERLLAWERGEDLSAVHALARRYVPIRRPPPIARCQCLLCYKPNDNNSNESTAAATTTISDSSLGSSAGDSSTARESEDKASATGSPSAERDDTEAGFNVTTDSSISEEEEAYDRSLNLYARLYSRKGPWFRVDDIFKYYIPKCAPPDTPAAADDCSKPPSPAKPASSPSKFFQPKSVKKTNPRETKKPSKSSTIDSFIDQEHVNRQLEAVRSLLQDLQQLYGMGLIRSFENEQECGQTIGQVQKYGLLRQEEQRSILTKLGGTRKQQMQRTNGSSSYATRNSAENLIWKQMCQQQSILAQSTVSSDKQATVLLPVAKHVDQALIASWATSLVLRSKANQDVDYIPQGLLKSITAPVQQIIHQLLKEHLGSQNNCGISLTCLRLREAPLESLRRSCRLYLCATSGCGEMRGDTGTNGWKSLPHESIAKAEGSRKEWVLPTNVVSPPGSQNWHHTVYPGRDYRFKLISCLFQRAHQPLYLKTEDEESSSPTLATALTEEEIRQVQVFPSVSSFELWELSVELRSNVDYLIEANELALYNERKRARKEENEGNGQMDDPLELSAEEDKDDDFLDQQELQSPLDFLGVLTLTGRKAILHRFALAVTGDPSLIAALEQRVEDDVETLLGYRDHKGSLKNDCEKVLGVIGIISASLLSLRNESASRTDVDLIYSRPWLRHLWWEGCIAYLLWDIIPILERRGFYQLATNALEILLFGKLQSRGDACQVIPKALVTNDGEIFLAQAYLSRRARGKAFERLVIDYMHILRQKQKEAVAKEGVVKAGMNKKRKRKSQDTTAPSATVPSTNDIIAQLCDELLQSCVSSGQITFCAARTLARRLKRPLSETLSHLDVYEINELGHRLSSDFSSGVEPDPEQSIQNGKKTKKYSDWAPITDYAVANAMTADTNTVGARCSFVGFEDRDETPGHVGSLNVEELALEYYNSGRLPKQQSDESSTVRGGWIGWHDEGGKLKALFRILSSTAILGTDWGCPNYLDVFSTAHNATIHLTPYQGAPFDLHVGAEREGSGSDARLGFYKRRRVVIDKFLTRLEELSPVEVADVVHRSIAARFQYANATQQADPTLERDVSQGRTLSAMAAGFGGKMLASMCRCLFFDYRHYSGGLPDLTLFRAIYERDECHKEELLVDLGSWIGEAFSPEQLAEAEAKSVASMFEDQDEEFLGCGKVGDSGRRGTRGGRPNNRTMSRNQEEEKYKPKIKIPDELVLRHEGRKVRVECMLVEVKSQNDRLDPRQEDWLNVLDRHGNVRVCKFGARKKEKQQKVKGADKPA